MTHLEIQIENFFARTDLEFIDCPLCQKPLLITACENRQEKYPPSKVNGDVTPHEKQYRCATSGCDYYIPTGVSTKKRVGWNSIYFPYVKPRLTDEQLEKAHELRRMQAMVAPLRLAERYND